MLQLHPDDPISAMMPIRDPWCHTAIKQELFTVVLSDHFRKYNACPTPYLQLFTQHLGFWYPYEDQPPTRQFIMRVLHAELLSSR